jgi:hypothetical protein
LRAPRRTRVEVATPAPRAVWQAAYDADPKALATQSAAWLDAVCAAGPYVDASRAYDFGGGRVAVLPLVARRGLPRAVALRASLPPAWGMGGLVAADGAGAAEIASVFADLASLPALRTTVRPSPLEAALWEAARPPGCVAVRRRAHVLDLSGGFACVWSDRFSGNARTSVRRAEKAGVAVESDATGRLMPVFHELYLQSLDRWARKQHEPRVLAQWRGRRRDSLRKLMTLARVLGDDCRVWVASLDGRALAAIVVLGGPNAHYTRGAMSGDVPRGVTPNDLLHSRAIEDACARGCRRYHMGESGWSRPLSRFKEKFGAVPVDYAEYVLERVPLTSADRRLRGLVKSALRFRDA